jgi:hypothetical protein
VCGELRAAAALGRGVPGCAVKHKHHCLSGNRTPVVSSAKSKHR